MHLTVTTWQAGESYTWYASAWWGHGRGELTLPCLTWRRVSAGGAQGSSRRWGPKHSQACSGSRRGDHDGSSDEGGPPPQRSDEDSSHQGWGVPWQHSGCGWGHIARARALACTGGHTLPPASALHPDAPSRTDGGAFWTSSHLKAFGVSGLDNEKKTEIRHKP